MLAVVAGVGRRAAVSDTIARNIIAAKAAGGNPVIDWAGARGILERRGKQWGYPHAPPEGERQPMMDFELTDEHKTRLRQLAADFPALWSDPAIPQRERKRIARLLSQAGFDGGLETRIPILARGTTCHATTPEVSRRADSARCAPRA